MAKRGRKPGFVMPQEHRLKIKIENILNRLNKIATGEVEGSSVQVTAALGLLRKVMPDLAQTTLEGGEKPITQRTIVTGVPRAADIHADVTSSAADVTSATSDDDAPSLAARH